MKGQLCAGGGVEVAALTATRCGVHNLRSSLDLLAGDLVRQNGGSAKGVYFPFAEYEAGLDAQIASKKFDRPVLSLSRC